MYFEAFSKSIRKQAAGWAGTDLARVRVTTTTHDPGSGTSGPPPAKLPALGRRKLMGSHHPPTYAFPLMTTDTTRPRHHHAAQQSWPRKVCLLLLSPPLPPSNRERTIETDRLCDVTSEISHRLGAPHVHGPDGLLLPVHAAAHVAAHEHAQIRPDRYERHLSLAHDSPALALSLPPSISFLRRPDAPTAPSSLLVFLRCVVEVLCRLERCGECECHSPIGDGWPRGSGRARELKHLLARTEC